MTSGLSTDHRGMRVLDLDECLERLRSTSLGRLAFSHDGDLVVLPVTFGMSGTSVVFRTSWGSKLQAAGDAQPVAFEVDDFDLEAGTGWSVVVKGSASTEYDTVLTGPWSRLGVPYLLPDTGDTFWVRVVGEEISGREILPR